MGSGHRKHILMPLIHSSSPAAFKSNFLAEQSAGKPKDQALAIAYATKRRGRAAGGISPPPAAPWTARMEARGMNHVGPINSIVPGRTDRHNMNVAPGSYVLPSSHVAFLGQDNTQAGMAVLNKMFSSGPYGASLPSMAKGKGAPPPPKISSKGFAQGGASDSVPIVTAGGEYVIPPEKVAQIGGGDIDHGHKILDKWVTDTRKKHIETLKKLPGPSKS